MYDKNIMIDIIIDCFLPPSMMLMKYQNVKIALKYVTTNLHPHKQIKPILHNKTKKHFFYHHNKLN